MNLQPGELFANRYRLIEHLGSGGFAQVWKVSYEAAGGKTMALKIFSPDQALDDYAIRQFQKEYTLTLDINHAHLRKAQHFDIEEGRPYLLLSYCEEGSLERWMKQKGTMDEKTLARLLVQIAPALEYLHQEKVVHQDIKPENVMISKPGHYLLADFGISGSLRKSVQQKNGDDKAWTVSYTPPERFTKVSEPLPASDIFSLGVMMIELLTGMLPWNGMGGVHLMPDSPMPELPDGISAELESMILACLQHDPNRRPSAAEIARAARKFLDEGKWPVFPNGVVEKAPGRVTERIINGGNDRPTPTIPKDPTVDQKSGNVNVILGVLLALIVVSGGVYGWYQWKEQPDNVAELPSGVVDPEPVAVVDSTATDQRNEPLQPNQPKPREEDEPKPEESAPIDNPATNAAELPPRPASPSEYISVITGNLSFSAKQEYAAKYQGAVLQSFDSNAMVERQIKGITVDRFEPTEYLDRLLLNHIAHVTIIDTEVDGDKILTWTVEEN